MLKTVLYLSYISRSNPHSSWPHLTNDRSDMTRSDALRTSPPDNPVESLCAFASVCVICCVWRTENGTELLSHLFCQEGGMTLYQECSAECGPMEFFVGICGGSGIQNLGTTL